MTIPLALMKQDFSGLILDWGVTCTVTRFSGAINSSGHSSGTFVTVGTERLYIQAADRRNVENFRGDAGILEIHTHEAFERFSGLAMKAEDRIAVPGEVYVYDVIHAEIQDNHRVSRLKQTKRS